MSREIREVARPFATLTAVSVKVPPFWRWSPEVWFFQLKVQFTLAGITIDTTKFNHVLVGLDEESFALVVDVLCSAGRSAHQATVDC